MKIQDILFLALFVLVVLMRKPRIALITGILSLLLSIPLFYLKIFFTAERLTWYASAFILVGIISQFRNILNEKKNLKK